LPKNPPPRSPDSKVRLPWSHGIRRGDVAECWYCRAQVRTWLRPGQRHLHADTSVVVPLSSWISGEIGGHFVDGGARCARRVALGRRLARADAGGLGLRAVGLLGLGRGGNCRGRRSVTLDLRRRATGAHVRLRFGFRGKWLFGSHGARPRAIAGCTRTQCSVASAIEQGEALSLLPHRTPALAFPSCSAPVSSALVSSRQLSSALVSSRYMCCRSARTRPSISVTGGACARSGPMGAPFSVCQ